MTTKFEIGKKYIEHGVPEFIYTCVGHTINGNPIFQHCITSGIFVGISTFEWVEYHEPIKKSWWVNIYFNPRTKQVVFGSQWNSKESAVAQIDKQTGENRKFVETVEFSYTMSPEKVKELT